jgi:hypothetical protein
MSPWEVIIPVKNAITKKQTNVWKIIYEESYKKYIYVLKIKLKKIIWIMHIPLKTKHTNINKKNHHKLIKI